MSMIAPSPGVAVHSIQRSDARESLRLLRDNPEVACLEWESEELLAEHIQRNDDLSVVARTEAGQIIGVLIAGSYGVRGTISHIVVDQGWRRKGIAAAMVTHVLG